MIDLIVVMGLSASLHAYQQVRLNHVEANLGRLTERYEWTEQFVNKYGAYLAELWNSKHRLRPVMHPWQYRNDGNPELTPATPEVIPPVVANALSQFMAPAVVLNPETMDNNEQDQR